MTGLPHTQSPQAQLPHVYPTVVHMLAEAAQIAPQREAVVCEGERLNYGEYQRCVAWFAHELIELGAGGGRVGIVLGNSIDICVAVFAIHAARAQAVPINPAYTERELRHILQDADVQVVIYSDDKRDLVEMLAADLR
ncbi:MAG: class I adenylate-forming enzyme family protein, partial [Sterolibacterium sp.]